jgi:hypothetical protein
LSSFLIDCIHILELGSDDKTELEAMNDSSTTAAMYEKAMETDATPMAGAEGGYGLLGKQGY